MKKQILIHLIMLIGLPLSYGQEAVTYQRPPEELARLLEAPSSPQVSFSPDRRMIALLTRPELPGIEEVSRPELRLAGLRIDPNNFGPSRSAYYNGLSIRSLNSKEERAVSGLPEPLLMNGLSWSPDGKQIAFLQNEADAIQLWVIDVAKAEARLLSDRKLNAVLGNAYSWLTDSKGLVVSVRPLKQDDLPKASRVPLGPVVEENLGKKAPSRTYQDLLKNPHDEAVFSHYASAELLVLGLDGRSTDVLETALWMSFEVSPNQQYLLASKLVLPFSYLVPYYRFTTEVQLYSLHGDSVLRLANKPLGEYIPSTFNAVERGPRGHSWRPDAPASVYWVEALDEGNPKNEVPHRDKLMLLEAPFNGEARELLRTELRYSFTMWGDDYAWVRSSWTRSRKEHIHELIPSKYGIVKLIRDRSYEDAYSDPGRPLMRMNENGRSVIWQHQGQLYLAGQGASEAGDMPFLDSYDVKTGKTKRIWRCEAPYYESVVSLVDPSLGTFITSRESQTENPNYFLRGFTHKNSRAITSFTHPFPQLKDIQKQQLRYQRADGIEMTADLYLPAGYDSSKGPLPAFVWAYPREYKSRDAAGQVKGSSYRFTRISWGSPVFWVLRGYAVFDNASMPIVGEQDQEPNDTYVQQLVANAEAIINYGSSLGVLDRERVAVGGHSYGAFMTANLLAHTQLFKAGIARSGAYNRTLTPFGFQAEERTYWQAPEVYYQMSPFSFADKIKTPLLIIHGEADNNSGTFPIQSERLYQAIKGHGGTVRYVVLPHESHGYRANESVMHMLWEMDRWLEAYLK
jgi:dipeptidyl aminopeptidase/acylaminoacyl peptidase